MAKTTTTSTQFTLNWRDALKGLIVAVITPVFTILIDSINQGHLNFNWKAIGVTALGAALAYLLKNFLSPGQIVIHNEEAAKAVKAGEAEVNIKSV